ncbi:MAG: polysaccharide deacetylase family protein [Endomicrobium sp.]|uniref:polysaccharide deacetylase family protein n=1 Tax=Candidatus Endomicrobiellum cubanum TaxID=3242325 RepID=UPI002832D021|nr:polysaccharide deacetylase family protein [Endomicrobium sp.]
MKKLLLTLCICLISLSLMQAKTFYADGPKSFKKVALTFDDGPGKATEKILEILKKQEVRATFFMLGVSIIDNPGLAKVVLNAGHEIANHTYGHINFYAYKNEDKALKMEQEILKTESIIKNALGVKTYLVRFPHGYAKKDSIEVAEKLGYYVINWSFGTDWKDIPAYEMYLKYKNAITDGAIFLMHDLFRNEKVLSFLDTFIDDIKNKGYEIVTISELLDIKN